MRVLHVVDRNVFNQSEKRSEYSSEFCMRIRRTTGSPVAYAPIAEALPAYVGVPPHTTWHSTQFTVSGTDSSSGGGSSALPAWWTCSHFISTV
eukprot:SAG31_NODE_2163_length_6293_cov_2.483532_7_plen_93_part_00